MNIEEIAKKLETDILENEKELKKNKLPAPDNNISFDEYYKYITTNEKYKSMISNIKVLINKIINDEENRHRLYSEFDDEYDPHTRDDRFNDFVMGQFHQSVQPETSKPTLFGYVRVSTSKQDTAAQIEALQAHGVYSWNIFTDVMSGSTTDRPELNTLIKLLNPGDVLYVWKLDRLGRSVSHLCEIINILQGKGVIVRSLSDGLTYDPSSLMGRMLMQQMAIFAELERGMIQERAKLGMDYAKKHGTKSGKAIGRPTVSKAKLGHAMDLIAGGDSLTQVARKTGISRTKLFMETKRLKEEGNLQRQATIFDAIGSTKKRKG